MLHLESEILQPNRETETWLKKNSKDKKKEKHVIEK